MDLDQFQTKLKSLLLGSHPKVDELRRVIEKIAPTLSRVLIVGPSGTGKEIVAQAIHLGSQRSQLPMVKVNCASIPHGLMESELFGHEKGAFTGAIKAREGVFERAHGGTLFLDEVGELDLDVQAKLLRVLQSGEFSRVGGEVTIKSDVRLIAATNKDLKKLTQLGKFRDDLYYRLNVVTVHVPALKDRASDIPLLANTFLAAAINDNGLTEKTISKSAMNVLLDYSWPGNIRELKNIIERSAILSPANLIDELSDLPSPLKRPIEDPSKISEVPVIDQLSLQVGVMTWDEFQSKVGKSYLQYIISKTNGNITEAARILDLERAYLYKLSKKLGIQRDVNFE
ncbi:MAG: sigma-54 dependent transcriptional regulator [Proteobacteria bacterium]|nr:sigma-54 dependent transcriptional regulator [Pseudomonadota bacterium]